MNGMAGERPSNEERSRLFEEIGPLPLRGAAWPAWTKVLACLVLIVIAVQLVRVAAGPSGRDVSPLVAGSLLICFLGLLIVARFMLVSETQITQAGITQSWITRREIAWDDIQTARFIPMLTSKRLVCFTGKGRPVIFQGSTRELQIAFARIALVYRRRV